jgi:hypothetical protein
MTTPDTGPARLTISRRSPKDVRTRQVVIALDGATVATLLFGEEYSTEITAGPHTLRVHNTLVWKTVNFEAKPGDHIRFTVVNRTGWGTWWMLSLFGAGPLYLTVERDE